ncbi:dihydrolipoyl dehydrogenase [Candidatus Saganbacteria bacterium CG08_land_8_20_14_0_20_45_16]|uniref:Dihydrolipoyl dehydrogenase n=1 Tax=Candidatus Saganbacteria bacterium CG08_land_8_20_14_0_20_45_16 TaxID=2014293 RepID=A0A2H0Y1D8_UNCSA|nr:MAG: dihydrolipoyl dehydrogenase [Candidatus Saganbacteria bacterium CG08_land_8_20_14_0_20_45_16]
MSAYDLIVIGGGPGGYVAAIRAAQLGGKVLLIEKDKVGGTCLNRGCIPTKALIASIKLFEKIKKAESFGITSPTPTIDWAKIVERKDQIVAKIVKVVKFLLKKNRVEVIQGEGAIVGPGQVKVGSRDVQSQAIILATGSVPASIPGIILDGQQFVSSDEMLDLKAVPPKLDVVGGGVIGLHFAYIFATLGSEVTIYEALPDILAGVDEEVVALVKRQLKRKKIEVKAGTKFTKEMSCGKTLICVGRKPAQKEITVNEKMETITPGVYAIGDLVAKKMFAHVAYEQGVIAAENAMGKDRTYNYDCVPYAIYTNPEIAGVGLTSTEAGPTAKIGKFPYAALGIAQAMGEIEGFIKVIADKDNKLLGVHIIGEEATTLIGAATLALKNGLKVNQLAETFQAHPSYPEGLHEASLATLGLTIHTA